VTVVGGRVFRGGWLRRSSFELRYAKWWKAIVTATQNERGSIVDDQDAQFLSRPNGAAF
jgi:hypothetical protein